MPIIALLCLGMIVVVGGTEGFRGQPFGFYFFVILGLLVWGFVYYFMHWPLADSVEDLGDKLIVVRRSLREEIPVAEIRLAAVLAVGRSSSIVLYLAVPNRFGSSIRFRPRLSFSNDADAVAKELNQRAAALRRTA